jgi:hypothetical protein
MASGSEKQGSKTGIGRPPSAEWLPSPEEIPGNYQHLSQDRFHLNSSISVSVFPLVREGKREDWKSLGDCLPPSSSAINTKRTKVHFSAVGPFGSSSNSRSVRVLRVRAVWQETDSNKSALTPSRSCRGDERTDERVPDKSLIIG